MMKKKAVLNILKRAAVLCVLLVCLSVQALAYDGQTAESWLAQFALALENLAPLNDPLTTADPARPGEYLIEYEFGTVRSSVSGRPSAGDILEIDVRTGQVTDCRGVRVGMDAAQALGGKAIGHTFSRLYVLDVQDTGYGWSWAYIDEGGVYGVEYIAYTGDESGMREYTLTYVLDTDMITAIRFKCTQASIAQAQEGMMTAKEIAARQDAELLAAANGQEVFSEKHLQVMGADALGVPVSSLIAVMGEPQDVQTLPRSSGRMLVYDGAVVRLSFEEATGEEIVLGVSVSSPEISGPNGLTVGMTVQQAAALFRCDADVYTHGGTLYLEGEAEGDPPYGEMRLLAGGEMMLVYACKTEQEETALLEAGLLDGAVAYWRLAYLSETEGGVQ